MTFIFLEMSCTIEKALADAKALVERLREHDNAAEALIEQTTALNKRVEAMKQVCFPILLTQKNTLKTLETSVFKTGLNILDSYSIVHNLFNIQYLFWWSHGDWDELYDPIGLLSLVIMILQTNYSSVTMTPSYKHVHA